MAKWRSMRRRIWLLKQVFHHVLETGGHYARGCFPCIVVVARYLVDLVYDMLSVPIYVRLVDVIADRQVLFKVLGQVYIYVA